MRGPHPGWWVIVLLMIIGIVVAAVFLPDVRNILTLIGLAAVAIVIVWGWLSS